jgi:hypothetical protein
MRSMLVVSMAVLVIGCGRSDSPAAGQPAGTGETGTAASGYASQPGAVLPGEDGGPSGADQTVTLIGCLQAAELGATATSGTDQVAPPSANTERFILRNGRAAGGDAGVGAHGAGASGGPLVSGTSSYQVEGNATELRAAVNKQVQITGRLESPAMGATPTADAGTPRLLVATSIQAVSSSCASQQP